MGDDTLDPINAVVAAEQAVIQAAREVNAARDNMLADMITAVKKLGTALENLDKLLGGDRRTPNPLQDWVRAPIERRGRG